MSTTLPVLLATVLAAAPPEGEPLPEGAVARFGTRHLWCGEASAALFTPDGKKLLVGTKGSPAFWVFDVKTGARERAVNGIVFPLRIAPEGRWLCPEKDSGLALVDPDTGEARTLLRPADETKPVDAALSPDGKTLAVGTNSGVLLIDVTSGKETARINLRGGKDLTIAVLEFSPDGRYLGVGFGGGNVWVWDLARNRRARWYDFGGDTDEGRVTGIAFDPGGRRVAATGYADGKPCVRMFDWDDEGEVPGFAPAARDGGVFRPRFGLDGKSLLVLGTEFGRLYHLDAVTGKQLRAVGPERKTAWYAVLCPAGKTLAVLSGERVHLLDAKTGKALFPAGNRGLLAVHSAGQDTAVAADVGGNLHFWDPATGKPKRTLAVDGAADFWTGRPLLPALSPDGTLVATVVGEPNKRFSVINARDGKEVFRGGGEGVGGLAFSPDGGRLAVAVSGEAPLEVWDARAGRRLRSLKADKDADVSQPLWSPDGKTIALCNPKASAVRVYDAHTGKLHATAATPGMEDAAFLGNGRRLVCTSNLRRAVVFRVGKEDGQVRGTLETTPTAVAGSRDGRWFAVGDELGNVRLFETDGPREAALSGHDGAITGLAFTPDCSRLLSASADSTALVWDLKSVLARKPAAAPKPRLEAPWALLADPDPQKAARAQADLEESPAEAVKLLAARVKPAADPDPQLLARLLRELDGKSFQAREKAARELERLGDRAEAALRAALREADSLELKKRLGTLLEKLDGPPADPETLRAVRAAEVLETIGSDEAKALLRELSKGADDARLTREAKAALDRLGAR